MCPHKTRGLEIFRHVSTAAKKKVLLIVQRGAREERDKRGGEREVRDCVNFFLARTCDFFRGNVFFFLFFFADERDAFCD